VHAGFCRDEGVDHREGLCVLLTAPGSGDRESDRENPVFEPGLHIPEPALEGRGLVPVSPAANSRDSLLDLAQGQYGDMEPVRLGIWKERTGRVRVLSRNASVVIGSWTPRRAGHSLLAWEPGGCAVWHCPLKITNTSTMRTVTVRSPLRYGFMISQSGAAFSPCG
jgi:hypothetical protein